MRNPRIDVRDRIRRNRDAVVDARARRGGRGEIVGPGCSCCAHGDANYKDIDPYGGIREPPKSLESADLSENETSQAPY